MAYRVVCISPLDGARGEEVVPAVADRLGFRLVDEEIIRTAADEAGVDVATMADVEQRRSFMDRLLGGMGASAPAATLAMAGYVPDVHMPGGSDLRGLIRTTIEEIAAQGDVVIAAHAASHALADRDGVLRVMLTASPQARRDAIALRGGLDEKAAASAVQRGDVNRADYLKRFYGASAELPTHYDIVINTDRVTPEDAASLVLSAARSQQIPA
jgi:cytidylate kinase